jgi:hypothetical protein
MDPASSISGWVQSPSEPQRRSGNVQATKAAAQDFVLKHARSLYDVGKNALLPDYCGCGDII